MRTYAALFRSQAISDVIFRDENKTAWQVYVKTDTLEQAETIANALNNENNRTRAEEL